MNSNANKSEKIFLKFLHLHFQLSHKISNITDKLYKSLSLAKGCPTSLSSVQNYGTNMPKSAEHSMLSMQKMHGVGQACSIACQNMNRFVIFRFVHAINVNAFTYHLQYLHARFPDRDFLTRAGALCPDIKELLIEDQVKLKHIFTNIIKL